MSRKKDTMWKVLSGLVRNCKKSDRELAKELGVSQPTITRTRRRLEAQGFIQEYTLIPNFRKLGYEILAINFLKYEQLFDEKKVQRAREILSESLRKGPFEILMAERGMGCGYNAVFISVHKNYASLVNLKNWARQFASLGLLEIESFLINLKDEVHYKPLTFSTLAKHIVHQDAEKE